MTNKERVLEVLRKASPNPQLAIQVNSILDFGIEETETILEELSNDPTIPVASHEIESVNWYAYKPTRR